MSVDDLMDRARPLVGAGVPSKSAIQKSLKIGWDKAVEIHDRLSREASEAARSRALGRRSKMRRGGVQKTAGRRLRAPRSVLPAALLSPTVPALLAPVLPQINLRPGEVPAPARGLVQGPFAAPVLEPADTVDHAAVEVKAEGAAAKPRRRVATWPVILLMFPATVAIWSGWVDLGRLTGFGVVHPFPGIFDEVQLNTAITLPVGLETYASYALYVWLSGLVVGRAKRFAMWSAIGSLVLGAAGQAIYHLMVAAGWERAPWPVTTVVACIPVAVVGLGAALRHLAHMNEAD